MHSAALRGNRQIALAVTSLLDEVSLRPESGGLQRWCRDLATVLQGKGYSVTVFQKSSRPISATLDGGAQVVGIRAPMRFWGHLVYGRALMRSIDNETPTVFVSQELMLGCSLKRAVAVNHGIWWDSDFPLWKRSLNRRLQGRMLARTRGVICVDTNYINWCHAEIPQREKWREKLCYIPNYADEGQFSLDLPAPPAPRAGPVRILYPRRLHGGDLSTDGRGAGLFLEALLLLHEHGFVFEAEFAGPGPLKGQIATFAKKNGIAERVRTTNYSLDDMPTAYQGADIVVVPTIAHEGTSLAAVEAMAAGKPTVVTHIGGLPNLVLNSVNGFIADLSAESLCNAILLAAQRCGDTAWSLETSKLTASAFGKQRWETAVWAQLQRMLNLQ